MKTDVMKEKEFVKVQVEFGRQVYKIKIHEETTVLYF